jgi:imidazolonepropionase
VKIITNIHIATMADIGAEPDNGYGIIENAALVVISGKIAWIGKKSKLPDKYRNSQDIINYNNQWLTPGLIDCHTHIVYAGNRANEFAERLQGISYEDIAKKGGGIFATVQATRKSLEQELYAASLPRVMNLLKEGVTTLEIKSGYGLDLDTECKMLRVARNLGKNLPVSVVTTYLGAHTCPKEYNSKDYIDYICKQVLPIIVDKQLVDHVDIFCENIAFDTTDVAKLFGCAQEYALPVKIHAEQLSDQGGAIIAAEHRALSADHLEFATEQAVQALSTSGTVAVLLPGAYYCLGGGKKPPLELLRKHAVPIAIATDSNPGSSPVTSILLMLNMACILLGLTPKEALLGVTRNAAKALGQINTIGTLEVGKQADFVVWDIQTPDDLSYNVGLNPCSAIYRHGVEV